MVHPYYATRSGGRELVSPRADETSILEFNAELESVTADPKTIAPTDVAITTPALPTESIADPISANASLEQPLTQTSHGHPAACPVARAPFMPDQPYDDADRVPQDSAVTAESCADQKFDPGVLEPFDNENTCVVETLGPEKVALPRPCAATANQQQAQFASEPPCR